jgi:hypothetical protein
MRVCIDTNVMLSALAKGSPMQPLFAAIVAGRIELVITFDFMGSFPNPARLPFSEWSSKRAGLCPGETLR